mgnify:CR=1 FL=1
MLNPALTGANLLFSSDLRLSSISLSVLALRVLESFQIIEFLSAIYISLLGNHNLFFHIIVLRILFPYLILVLCNKFSNFVCEFPVKGYNTFNLTH